MIDGVGFMNANTSLYLQSFVLGCLLDRWCCLLWFNQQWLLLSPCSLSCFERLPQQCSRSVCRKRRVRLSLRCKFRSKPCMSKQAWQEVLTGLAQSNPAQLQMILWACSNAQSSLDHARTKCCSSVHYTIPCMHLLQWSAIVVDITGHTGLVSLPHCNNDVVETTFQHALTFERPCSDTQLCTACQFAGQILSIVRQTLYSGRVWLSCSWKLEIRWLLGLPATSVKQQAIGSKGEPKFISSLIPISPDTRCTDLRK